jgi:hypothetical protein
MPLNIQPSIATIGLQPYLDSTAATHNGKGYDWFITALQNSMSKNQMCREMGVSRATLNKYIMIRKVEKKNGQ